MIQLPVDRHLSAIADAVSRVRAVVVTAAPGAGKTTRVPPALLDAGPLVLLQPRRVAARAIAQRIADERDWTVGREVGWQVRLDARKGPGTRLLVVTEGILTAFLQSDPLLSAFNTIVLDEFHERSIHADLAIALARQAWEARDDLRIVVMSATLDAGAVSRFLGGCPVIEIPGALHPVEIEYAAEESVADVAARMLTRTPGDLLCFLPGAAEISKAVSGMRARLPDAIDLLPLHGALDAADQDAALRPSAGRRRIVVATNIAETSLTVPGVTAVIDSGLQKVARYDAARGIDSLETERITQDSAEQRAGRAGRISAGLVCRLWDASLRLRKHREPDITRIDLAGPCLDVLAWGTSPQTLEWFERPQAGALEAAMTLLRRLGAVEGDGLTALGRRMHRLPVHPRLARMLLASGGAQNVVRACALLAERQYLPAARPSSVSDLLSAVDAWHEVPPHIQRVAADIEARSADARGERGARGTTESGFLQAVFAGYPDRVAQRREPGSTRLKLASGGGAVLAPESGVRAADFLAAIDTRRREVRGARPGTSADDEVVVRMASLVEREWLVPTGRETIHRYDEATRSVRASIIESYDALTLSETPVRPDPAIAADFLAEAWKLRPSDADLRLLRRIRFAGVPFDTDAAVRAAAYGASRLDDVSLRTALSADQIRTLDRDAPETLTLPSGRSTSIDYSDDGSIGASAKLQELFGLADTPRIGRSQQPIVITLLAPNGRPVQVTQDLRSFWNRTYPEVRKELRGRYPKHPWPDDPWTATPTAKTTRRSGPTRS